MDWGNLLYGIGLTLASGSAGSRGDFSLPMQHLQMKANLEQNKLAAEQRKQAYALEVQKAEEERKQHQWKQMIDVLGNDKITFPQQMGLIKEMKDNPFAVSAAQNLNEKMLGELQTSQEFLPQKPEQYLEDIKNGKKTWGDLTADLEAAKPLKKAILEKRAEAKAYQSLQRMAAENPDDEAIQEAFKEMQAEKQQKIIKAQVEKNTAPFQEQEAALKPIQQIASINHLSSEMQDKSTMNKLGEGLIGKPWKDLTQEEKQQVINYEQSREVEKQEAGARAREQVKVETNLAPGVMMLDTLTKLSEQPGMFVSDKDGTWERMKQMGRSRLESMKGTDQYRLWTQMSDGMRATLARMAMEVGNLAATEQDRALHLIADPFGGMRGLPDSLEVARKKHELLGEFLRAGLEGSQGPDSQSRVQAKLRSVLDRLDEVAPLPAIKGEISPEEGRLITQMKAEGKSRRTIQAEILKRRNP
jgi:hypothetical protein